MDTLLTLIATLVGLERQLLALRAEARKVELFSENGPATGFPTLREHIGPKAATGLRRQLNRLAADLRREGVETTPALLTLNAFASDRWGADVKPTAADALIYAQVLWSLATAERDAREMLAATRARVMLAEINAA